VTCAEPKLQRCSAGSTSFIYVEVVWLSTTMFVPAPTYPPPGRPTRAAEVWRRTRGAREPASASRSVVLAAMPKLPELPRL